MDEMYSPPPLTHMPFSEEWASEPLMMKRLKARVKCVVGHLPILRFGDGGQGRGGRQWAFLCVSCDCSGRTEGEVKAMAAGTAQ